MSEITVSVEELQLRRYISAVEYCLSNYVISVLDIDPSEFDPQLHGSLNKVIYLDSGTVRCTITTTASY